MKKILEFWRSDAFNDDTRFAIIMLAIVLLYCALMISIDAYNIPKILPTESEAREKILVQHPDCEGEIEAIVELETFAWPNYGGHTSEFNYLVCESHGIEIQYFLPRH